MDIKQQLSRCRTNLSLERVKARRYKRQLDEANKFNKILLEENTLLHRRIIELEYKSKEE